MSSRDNSTHALVRDSGVGKGKERVTVLGEELEPEAEGESRDVARREGMDRRGSKNGRRCDGEQDGGGVGIGLEGWMLLYCVMRFMM